MMARSLPLLVRRLLAASLLAATSCLVVGDALAQEPARVSTLGAAEASQAASPETGRPDLIANLTIFVLAVFVGFEVITKVPQTLHTPLMSGTNAIAGIILVGALAIAGTGTWGVAPLVGFVAVVLATINVVGGFAVTHRMLAMFRRH